MIKVTGLGQDQTTIAAWSGRLVLTVRRWLARFRWDGLAARPEAPRCGRPVQADAAYQDAQRSAVMTAPSGYGREAIGPGCSSP